MRGRMIALGSTLALAACIPRGGDDYRIGHNSETPAAEQTESLLDLEQALNTEPLSWDPAVVQRNARRVADSTHVVLPGDGLFAIANKTGASATRIAEDNDLQPPYTLRGGDRLTIPGGLYHRVGAGETGIAIARAYDMAWSEIVAINALQPPYTLQIGQNLRLPEQGSVHGVSLETRAKLFKLNIDDIVTGGNPATAFTPASALPTGFTGRFAWPLTGNIVGRFGSQGGGRVNDGLNIAASGGTTVMAAAPGNVVYSGNEIGVFGGLVLVDHGGGWVTAYGHLGRLDVKRGDQVVVGQSLGSVGETGYVTQSQLHFEIRKERKPLDPLTKLPFR